MADTFRADPELLCQAGNALAGHGEALLALQLCGDSDLAAAPSGWAGSSADALTELLDSWADSTRRQAGWSSMPAACAWPPKTTTSNSRPRC